MPRDVEKGPGIEDEPEKPRGDGTFERQERSEVLLRFLDSAENIEPFRGKKLEEIFSNEEQKRAFIDGLKPEEFTELLNGINGILREKKKEEWGMDGESVVIESPLLGVDYVPPRQEDKLELLKEVLSSAKAMNKNERSLEDIALLISSSLNAIHLYADANGRMSRLIYLLLGKDIKRETKPELKQVLSEYGRGEVNIDPRLIREEIEDMIEGGAGVRNPEKNPDNITNLWIEKLGGSIEFGEGIDEKDKRLFSELYNKDSEYLFWSVFKYLQDNPGVEKEKYINKFPKRAAIVADRLCKDLTREGMTQILQNYGSLKKEYVEKLIDCIVHPEKKEYQAEYGGQRISLKDYFKLRIQEETEKIEKEDGKQLGQAREEAKEAFGEQKENKWEGEIRRAKNIFGGIFEAYGKGSDRVKDIIERIKPFLESGLVDKKEIRKLLKNCENIKNKDEFAEKVFSSIQPILRLRETDPKAFGELQRKSFLESGKFTKVNEILFFGRDKDSIHIHLAPSWELGISKVMELTEEGLKKLARIVEKKKEIKEITATSWIVAEHPKIIENLGFTLRGRIDEEARRKYFAYDDREVSNASMRRKEFLDKYLEKEK